jgi:hypothetical protein
MEVAYTFVVYDPPITINDADLTSEGRQILDELAQRLDQGQNEHTISVLSNDPIPLVVVIRIRERKALVRGCGTDCSYAKEVALIAIRGLYSVMMGAEPPKPILGNGKRSEVDSDIFYKVSEARA